MDAYLLVLFVFLMIIKGESYLQIFNYYSRRHGSASCEIWGQTEKLISAN